ncbi:unnamed protein product [Aureobasidium pullulans]|nr:unnamed protein product [Aureobasidium pullulans]
MATLLWGYLRVPIMFASGLGAVVSSGLYYYQNELIYPRNIPANARTDVPRPAQLGLDAEELSLPTPDGETLSAFLIKPGNVSKAKNKGIAKDSQTGLDFIRGRGDLKNTEIDHGDIAGVILENTFLSIKKMIPR